MNFIVDDIGTVVESMRTVTEGPPYYIYGHRQEIANRLLEMDNDKVYKFKKYPLIALRMDIPEEKNNGVINYRLNIAIMMFTQIDINAEDRYNINFRTVLYPLYEQFLTALRNSGLFMWAVNQDFPPHTKFDRPYWGTPASEKNVRNIFNDPLDAIELIDLRISQEINKC